MRYFAPNIAPENHCFFGADGGVSQGKYQSLNTNLKSQDKKENLIENLELIAQSFHLSQKNMVLCRQGVTNHAEFVTEPSLVKITADALVSNRKDLILGIRTADCAPVLFYDKQAGVIAAAHAGWRGALRGVVENTVCLMEAYGAQRTNIHAAVGPCLQQKSFECMDDMRQAFLQETPDNQIFFMPGKDDLHFLFDLQTYVKNKLQQSKIANISVSGIDTFSGEKDFFSYRRFKQQYQISSFGDYPTQLSTIKL